MPVHFFKAVLVLVGVALIGVLIFASSGLFNPAADEPHWGITYKALNFIRERGIATRAQDIEVPDLDNAKLIRSGAGNYASMCVGCHLAPGESPGEIQRGMYPAPPNLSEGDVLDASRTFWTIKHGIKMSGMPAWGESMGDAPIWGMTAFVRRLPTMTAEQYKTLVAASGGHDHGDTLDLSEGVGQSDGTADETGNAGMQGMVGMDDTKDQHDGAAGESGHAHGDADEAPPAGMQEMEAGDHDDPGTAPHSHSGAAESASMQGMDHTAMPDTDKSADVEAQPPGMSDLESEMMQGIDHSSMAGMKAPPKVPSPPHPASGPAEAALQAFQDALQVGNRDLAMQWLAPDVTVVEGGKTEPSREAYASHHMGSDMAFLKSSTVTLLDRRVQQDGDRARIQSTSRISARPGANKVDIISKEIAELRNTADGWRIARLEWSSEPVEN